MTQKIDALATSLERKWGIGRLPLLVSRETAERFGYWRDQLADLADGEFPDRAKLAELEGIVMRGWHALDAEAEAAGHQPMPPHCFEAEWAPGRVFAIALDEAHKQTLVLRDKAEGRDLAIFTIAEVAQLVASIPDVARIAELFPGAYISAQPAQHRGGRRKMHIADEIPFPNPEAEEIEA